MYITLAGYGHALTTKSWLTTVNGTPTTHLNRLYFCLNNNGYYKINDTLHPFKPNHLYIIPQNSTIKFYHKADEAFEHIFFDFTVNPLLQSTDIQRFDLNDYPTLNKHMEFIISYFDSNALYDISKYRNKKIFNEHKEITTHHLYALLLYLDRISPLFSDANSPLHQTISYIHSNYREDIKLGDLCKIALCNESTFIKQFKAITNKTPYQYIKDYRLSISCSMLQSHMPIKDIYEAVGFLSPSAFSNSFYKKYGIYPSEYRKPFLE